MTAKRSRRDWLESLGVEPKHGPSGLFWWQSRGRLEPIWPKRSRTSRAMRSRNVAVSGVTTGLDGMVGGACPVQGEGTVDGLPWYFRARSGEWTFSIAARPDGDPVEVRSGGGPGWRWSGDDDDEGWMPSKVAARIIRQCVAEFRDADQRAQHEVSA